MPECFETGNHFWLGDVCMDCLMPRYALPEVSLVAAVVPLYPHVAEAWGWFDEVDSILVATAGFPPLEPTPIFDTLAYAHVEILGVVVSF